MPMQRLSSVKTWACTHLKDDYSKIPTRTDYTIQLVHLPGRMKPSNSIVVGTALGETRLYFKAAVNVLAWLIVDNIEVGYISYIGDNASVVVYEDIVNSGIAFHEPFLWILQAADEVAVRRFEALLHHAFLLRGGPKRVISLTVTANFKEHFPGACRDIAKVANQRLAEWETITAPLGPDDGATTGQGSVIREEIPRSNSLKLSCDARCLTFSDESTVGTSEPSRSSPDSIGLVTIDITGASSITSIAQADSMCPEHVDISNSTSPTSQQTELSEADRHNLMIAEYNDSWNMLTRKIITITRLHAHEKGQLQAKIKELERAASSSSKKVSDAKKQMKKAQEKHKQAQEKIKKMQGQKREVEEKVRSAEAEVFKAQEEAQKAKGEAENYKAHRSTANKLCVSAQNDAAAWKSKHDAIAANFEEMRQAAMVWKAKRNKLRMSLNSVPGAQVEGLVGHRGRGLLRRRWAM